MTTLSKAINARHELVHRNVHKNPDGTDHVVDEGEIRAVIKAAGELIDHIEREWLRQTTKKDGKGQRIDGV